MPTERKLDIGSLDEINFTHLQQAETYITRANKKRISRLLEYDPHTNKHAGFHQTSMPRFLLTIARGTVFTTPATDKDKWRTDRRYTFYPATHPDGPTVAREHATLRAAADALSIDLKNNLSPEDVKGNIAYEDAPENIKARAHLAGAQITQAWEKARNQLGVVYFLKSSIRRMKPQISYESPDFMEIVGIGGFSTNYIIGVQPLSHSELKIFDRIVQEIST